MIILFPKEQVQEALDRATYGLDREVKMRIYNKFEERLNKNPKFQNIINQ